MKIEETLAFITERCDLKPKLALLLRESLVGELIELKNRVEMSYEDIPHFRDSSLKDRNLKLIIGKYRQDTSIAIMTGRLHYYEGFSMAEVTYPFRVLSQLGVKTFILTSAVGLVSERGKIGDVMIIKDQLNLMGESPLRALPYEGRGELYPIMVTAYPEDLRSIARDVLKEMELSHFEGVYTAVSGPAYETRAEVEMLRSLGGDVVGMSTVPEVQAVVRYGGEVLGLSIVTNIAGGDTPDEEVNLMVGGVQERLMTAIMEIINKIIEGGLL